MLVIRYVLCSEARYLALEMDGKTMGIYKQDQDRDWAPLRESDVRSCGLLLDATQVRF